MWWKTNKWKIIVPVLIIAALAGAFYIGGDAPGLRGWKISDDNAVQTSSNDPPTLAGTPTEKLNGEQTPQQNDGANSEPAHELEQNAAEISAVQKNEPVKSELGSRPGGAQGVMTADEKLAAAAALAGGVSSPGVEQGDPEYSNSQGMEINPETGKDKYMTAPVPKGKPLPVEPQNVKITDNPMTCTISISCATILDNLDWLDPEKTELVPDNGWILKPTSVTFYEGESVFNVLLRACKQNGIHMEFEKVPMYNSAYIEGINNLYEFDCGELSGWMYEVNDWFPNYGCDRYQLKDGDVIEWQYTCTLGKDINGYYSVGS